VQCNRRALMSYCVALLCSNYALAGSSLFGRAFFRAVQDALFHSHNGRPPGLSFFLRHNFLRSLATPFPPNIVFAVRVPSSWRLFLPDEPCLNLAKVSPPPLDFFYLEERHPRRSGPFGLSSDPILNLSPHGFSFQHSSCWCEIDPRKLQRPLRPPRYLSPCPCFFFRNFPLWTSCFFHRDRPPPIFCEELVSGSEGRIFLPPSPP